MIALWKFAGALFCTAAAAMLTGCAGRQAARGVQCNVHIGGSVLTIAAEKRFVKQSMQPAAVKKRRLSTSLSLPSKRTGKLCLTMRTSYVP